MCQQNCIPWQLHGGFLVQQDKNGSKLLTLAVTRSVFGPARILLSNRTSIYSSCTVTLKMPKKWFYAVTVKLLYMEVLLVSRIPAGPKSLCVTAKVCSFADTSTKLLWLEVLTEVNLWPWNCKCYGDFTKLPYMGVIPKCTGIGLSVIITSKHHWLC